MISAKRRGNGFAISMLALGIAAASHSASAQTADCEYVVQNDWGSGAVTAIRITNTGSSAIEGWNVSWGYDNNSISNLWNANLSGSNPYSATDMGWNGTIQPGQTIEFGMQLANGDVTPPEVTGDVCADGGEDPVDPDPEDPVDPDPEDPVDPDPEDPVDPDPEDPDPEDPVDPDPEDPVDPDPVDPTEGTFRVDETGNITKNGEIMPVQCGSWFGLEGRHEPEDDPDNPGGAPMELFVGNMWWANDGQGTGRTIQQTMDEITDLGINVVRLPISPQTLDPNDPQGSGENILKNHESVRQDNARQAMEDFIVQAAENDIEVIVGIHSCSNYLGWRAGRLDATPPYADADRIDYPYLRDDYACGSEGVGSDVTVHEYNEELWLEDLREIARLQDDLGVDNIIGIDIFNEPWDYEWAEWKRLAENAYEAINEVNQDTLIFVQGVGAATSDGTVNPNGDEALNPNWGENFYPMADDPIDIPRDRLVLSPHTYGPSVFVQNHFLDPSQAGCDDLEGPEAGAAGCDILLDTTTLRAGWEQHFGYLRDEGYAMVIGEFGGNMDWPLETTAGETEQWSHVTPGVDQQWQEMFVDYMVEKDIQGCYWSINPESSDTWGIYEHAFEYDTNEDGWGTWLDFDGRKVDLLNTLWGQ